jgi:hypothetical protein
MLVSIKRGPFMSRAGASPRRETCQCAPAMLAPRASVAQLRGVRHDQTWRASQPAGSLAVDRRADCALTITSDPLKCSTCSTNGHDYENC